MSVRWLQSVFAALVVVALIAVPAFALRPAQQQPELPAAPNPPAAEQGGGQQADGQQANDGGEGNCHGIQRAYWAVSNNPGKGEGKQAAAMDLQARAAERDCELSEGAPADWPGGGPPPWAGNDAEGKGNGLGRPRWASEGDGPPWGPPPWAGSEADDKD